MAMVDNGLHYGSQSMEEELSKFSLPDDTAQIAAKIKAELEASGSKLEAELKSLFGTDVPAASTAAGLHPSAGVTLPQSSVGAYRSRLAATLKIDSSS